MRTPDPDFDRLRQALYGRHADRVPLAEVVIDEEVKEQFLGRGVNDLETDVEFYVKAGYDCITLGRRIAGFPPIWDAARLDDYYHVQRRVGHGQSAGVMNSWSDFRAYPWMSPGDLDFRILDKAEQALPDTMKVVRYVGPVFQMAWMLMGFEAFSYMLADEPGLVEAVMERAFELVHREVQDALQRDVVGAVWYVDDIAMKDRLMVSPAFLRKHFFPKLKMIGDCCKSRGVPLLYHTDGDISEVVPDIIDAGVNALHPVDPIAMDIYQFKNDMEGKLAVIGNVDVALLVTGTPRQVEEDTKKHIRLLAPGGGYVLSSGNSIPRAVKIENYRAMLETTLACGAYPISVT